MWVTSCSERDFNCFSKVPPGREGWGGNGEQSILKLVRRLRRLSAKGFQPHAKGVPTSVISQAKMKSHD